MAEICFGVVSESEASLAQCETSSRQARRRRMAFRRFKIVDFASSETESENTSKRQNLQSYAAACDLDCGNAGDHSSAAASELDKKKEKVVEVTNGRLKTKETLSDEAHSTRSLLIPAIDSELYPKFGFASVCGHRRDMEDAVAIHPLFHCKNNDSATVGFHYFGVYDGHGCSHVAMRCRERLHELMKEELEESEDEVKVEEWKGAMERSFTRMDKEVIKLKQNIVGANCRCELHSPECDAVGSTAVVAVVTPDKIVVSNCGDSRAILCRNGVPVLLTSDHKPDRPDELNRIQEAGGRVLYWDGPRVLGVLAMSRAIGDNYLKPYVSCEPEITITDRMAGDECLILASDGLWDVVSNNTACGVARMCLKGKGHGHGHVHAHAHAHVHAHAHAHVHAHAQPEGVGSTMGEGGGISDKACTEASMLLTKLALARHSSDNVSVVVVDLRRAT